MSAFVPSSRRVRSLLIASLGVLAVSAVASEHAAPQTHAADAASLPTTVKPAEAGGRKTAPDDAHAAPHAEAPGQDPMDRLRERLARKLGASKPPGAENPNLVRIVAKTGAGAHGDGGELVTTPSAAHAAAVARRAGRPAAAGGHAAPTPLGEPAPAHWEYGGAGGPDSWGRMKPEFSQCSSGKRQSPIDIRDGIRVDLEPVTFDYRPSSFKVVDNGHTVQVNVAAGNSIEVLGRRYELIQFHFHRPSEERIDGKQFEMVVHLVHRDLEGRLAVVAVLLDRGNALPAVQNVWNNLPLEKGEEVAARTLLSPADLLPADRSYYTYMGSLTTPPCSEGVLWMVMKVPMKVSAEQVGIFARLYPMNARPIQSAAGRTIKESN